MFRRLPRLIRIRSWMPYALQRLPAVVFLFAYVTLLLAVPAQLIFRPLGSPGTPANILGMGALLWWAASMVGGFIAKRRASPVRTMLGLTGLAVLAGYASGTLSGWYAPSDMRQSTDDVFSLVYPTAGQVSQAMITAADRGLLAFAGWLGVALLALDGLRHWQDLDRLIRWICWVTTLFALVGVYQFYTGVNLAAYISIPGLSPNSEVGASLTRSVLNRVSATSVHPIEFGVHVAAVFPFALHMALFRRRRLDMVPAFIIGLAVPLAVSRSAVITAVLGLIVLFVYWPKRWRMRALVIGPIAIIALRGAIPGLVGTIYSLFRGLATDPSVTGRTSDYAAVLELYGQLPWFGRGLFTFVPRFYRILDNQFLMLLLDLGIVGLTVVICLFIVGFFCALSARRGAAMPRDAHAALAIAASLLGVFISYLTFDAWGYSQTAGMSFLLLGLSGAAWRLARADGRQAATSTSPDRSLEHA